MYTAKWITVGLLGLIVFVGSIVAAYQVGQYVADQMNVWVGVVAGMGTMATISIVIGKPLQALSNSMD